MSEPLPEVPESLLTGYLDAALATLRAADQGELPGPLRQYQTWTPKRLRNPRVLGVVRRTLDLDESFRKAVDERVLDEEEALARLVRAGRHAEALASGETPEAVARVGIALGQEGQAAVQAAVAAATTSQAMAEAAAVRSALAGAESELDSARERAETEAAAARAARDELRAAREELRRVERERKALTERTEALERDLAQSAAALRAAKDEAGRPSCRPGWPSPSATSGPCAARPGRSTRRWPRPSAPSNATWPSCAASPGWRRRQEAEGRRERRHPQPPAGPSGSPWPCPEGGGRTIRRRWRRGWGPTACWCWWTATT